MATDSALPAIDDETKEMLENQVKKGKARKFVLIFKGADIRALVIFKKGPYGTKITAAKKAGFKGDAVCGIATGKGVSITFQIPGTPEVQEAMKAEGDVYTEDPCKIAKLREFLKDEGDLKFKPEFQIITRVDALAVVSEEDEEEDDLETGLAKQRLIEALKKVKPHIVKAIEANGARKEEVLAAAAKVKQLIQDGKFEEAQTAMLELGGLLREILKEAAKQQQATTTPSSSTTAPTTSTPSTNGTPPTTSTPPTTGTSPTTEQTTTAPTQKSDKKNEWDTLIKQLSPMLRAFVQFKLGDYATLGKLFKDAQALKPTNIDEAVNKLKECDAQVKSMEEKFRRAYEKVRDENATRFDNAAKLESIKDHIVSGRLDATTMATEFNYGAAVGKLRELIDLIHGESSKIEQELDSLYDEYIHQELAFERDPNVARDEVRKFLKSWDLVKAAEELKKFKAELKRARPIGLANLDEVQSRSEQAKLQNAQFARNTAMSLNAAMKLVGDDGKLRLDGDLLSDLPFVPSHDLGAVIEEIAHGGFQDLPQSVHALEVLKRLQADENVRNALNNVSAPPAQDGTAAKMIRATLGLKKDAPVTDADARRAALAALMFQARQGQVGSCFATATAVQIQRNNPEQFLADMQEMFATGKLTRTILHNGSEHKVEVPFNTEMLVSTLDKKTTVPRSGGNLHLSPDMAGSLDSLEIKPEDREQVIKDAAQDVRAKAAIESAMGELKNWLTPENKLKDLPGEAMKVLRANRSLSIKDALKQAITNLGMGAKGVSGDWCAQQQGHANMNAFAVSAGYTDYADYQTKTGKNVQDEYAKSQGHANAADWVKSFGLTKCDTFDNAGGSDSVSPQELLAEVVENRLPEDQRAAGKKAANDAFLGQQDNRLMRSWEYTIATMVERDPSSQSNGDRMNSGVNLAGQEKLLALANQYIADNGIVGAQQNGIRTIAREVGNEFFKKLSKASKAQYDPSTKSAKENVAKDGHSSSGGYGLYNGDQRIDSEAAFSQMLEQMMKEALTVTNTKGGWNGAAKNLAREFGADMIEHMKTKDFRDKCIEKNPTTDKDKLATPWTHTGGGDTDTLLQFYHDQRTPMGKVSTTTYGKPVNNAESLTEFLIDTLKGMKLGDKLAPDKAENAAIPVRAVGNHAFTLKPGNPALHTILNGEKSGTEVVAQLKANEIEKNKKRRGAQPVNNPPDGAVAKVIARVATIFGSRAPEVITRMNTRVTSAGVKEITMPDLMTMLRDEVNQTLIALYPNQNTQDKRDVFVNRTDGHVTAALLNDIIPKEEFEPLIDMALEKLKVIEEKRSSIKQAALKEFTGDTITRDQLDETLIRLLKEAGVDSRDEQVKLALNQPRGLVIADTNWGGGQHMVNFSMVVNPLTDVVEMWQMNEDGTGASPVKQDDWIKNSEWRVFNDTEAIGGAMGDNAWEVRRGELREKVKDCVSKRQGNISMMQSVLEIADQKFADGDKAAGEKALDRLDSLVKKGVKLTANVDEAKKALGDFKSAVQKVTIDESKEAAAFIDTLIREVGVLRDEGSIEDFATRRKSDLELLKQGKEHLGVDVDVMAILAKA